MENLSITSTPPPSQAQPQQTQLPPQFFTTAASLLELTDKKLLVSLRDGRKLIGILRSWDQYGNLVLQETIERRFLPVPSSSRANARPGENDADEPRHLYTDEERGVYIVRGENIVIMGELDLDKDELPPPNSTYVEPHDFHTLSQRHKHGDQPSKQDGQNAKDARRLLKLKMLGFEGEHTGDAIF